MYRYAFRLDDRDRSLGDGFGWTILLLADSGEVTREFLLRYGVELSVKTAHRVRFAFFSGISGQETRGFMNQLTVGRYSARAFLDLLHAGLERSSWRHRPLDWEGVGWRELRGGRVRSLHRRAADPHAPPGRVRAAVLGDLGRPGRCAKPTHSVYMQQALPCDA
ncbi:hypothetical protein AMK26_20670 [Streptomyces sp. CB03234]|uniref:hypothetical protein n=1 Tax=Streptomyces sp. (strain CB03234) TaxID=1703937 RepID=UPI00093EF32E|nr:hypothetical protein [Streptomyces sp. CB03234]OKK03817.1 hypothetical protein AMK26_20670 [Streptomyces sp. CB03234]